MKLHFQDGSRFYEIPETKTSFVKVATRSLSGTGDEASPRRTAVAWTADADYDGKRVSSGSSSSSYCDNDEGFPQSLIRPGDYCRRTGAPQARSSSTWKIAAICLAAALVVALLACIGLSTGLGIVLHHRRADSAHHPPPSSQSTMSSMIPVKSQIRLSGYDYAAFVDISDKFRDGIALAAGIPGGDQSDAIIRIREILPSATAFTVNSNYGTDGSFDDGFAGRRLQSSNSHRRLSQNQVSAAAGEASSTEAGASNFDGYYDTAQRSAVDVTFTISHWLTDADPARIIDVLSDVSSVVRSLRSAGMVSLTVDDVQILQPACVCRAELVVPPEQMRVVLDVTVNSPVTAAINDAVRRALLQAEGNNNAITRVYVRLRRYNNSLVGQTDVSMAPINNRVAEGPEDSLLRPHDLPVGFEYFQLSRSFAEIDGELVDAWTGTFPELIPDAEATSDADGTQTVALVTACSGPLTIDDGIRVLDVDQDELRSTTPSNLTAFDEAFETAILNYLYPSGPQGPLAASPEVVKYEGVSSPFFMGAGSNRVQVEVKETGDKDERFNRAPIISLQQPAKVRFCYDAATCQYAAPYASEVVFQLQDFEDDSSMSYALTITDSDGVQDPALVTGTADGDSYIDGTELTWAGDRTADPRFYFVTNGGCVETDSGDPCSATVCVTVTDNAGASVTSCRTIMVRKTRA